MDASRFLEHLCRRKRQLRLALAASVGLMVVLSPSFVAVSPGSATYLITVFQLTSLGFVVLLLGVLLLACRYTESETATSP